MVAFYRESLNRRVIKALPHYYERLRKTRELRALLLKKDAGSLYPGHDGDIYGDIINLIQQARLAMQVALAANDPQYYGRTSSTNPQARGFARHFGAAMSKYVPSIGMKHTLRCIVDEAFVSLGIGKTYLTNGAAVHIEADNYIVPGKPFFAPRTVDHFVWDQDVTDWRYCTILADRYRANIDRLLETKGLKSKQRNWIHRNGPDTTTSAEGEVEFNQRGSYGSDHQVSASLYISDVYIPEENIVQTWIVGDDFRPRFEEPLFEMEWDGKRPLGPYHFLAFGATPAGSIPSSPAQNTLNLHRFVQTLFRKLRDQAERSKQMTVSASGDEEDAEKVQSAEDGAHITLNNPDSVKELKLDGIDQQIYSMLGTAITMFDRAAGNPMQRLGLGQSADSATGESIVSDQIARLESHYQTMFHDLLCEVGIELGYMLYMDSETEIPMSAKVPGTDILVPDDWHGAYYEDPEQQTNVRWGDFDLHEIKPVPFSTRYRPPQQRLAEIDQRIQLLMPMEPLFNQRGKAFNVVRYLNLAAELSDTPELVDLWEDIEPPAPQQGGEQPGLLSGAQQHEYIHRSVSGSDQQDPMSQLMAAAAVAPQSNG